MIVKHCDKRCVHSETAQPDQFECGGTSPPCSGESLHVNGSRRSSVSCLDNPKVTRLTLDLIAEATSQCQQHRYRAAIETYKKVLGDVKKKSHPVIAAFLSDLARCHLIVGECAEAQRLLKRAVTITKYAFGLNHPDSALYLHNLAVCYQAQGKYAIANRRFQEASNIRKKLYGPGNERGQMPWNASLSLVMWINSIRQQDNTIPTETTHFTLGERTNES